MTEYSKSFEIEPNSDGANIAEAFGISGGYEKTVVDLEIPEKLPHVTYITGESGCGKSTLLDLIAEENNSNIYNHKNFEPEDGPLWSWAPDEDKGIEYMSKVGLGDATLFLSTYNELSDSQQYRAMLYKIVLDNPDVVFIDEFLSTLDRKTAKPVSYVFQKLLRRNNITAVVATAHDDLSEYLQPNLEIVGRAFPSRWSINKYQNRDIKNPIEPLKYEMKDADWYRNCRLAELHYKGKYTGGVKDYIACYYDGRLVGLLLATYRMSDGGRRISRVVVHPSYRSCGVGQRIVEHYLDMEPSADVVAQMAKFNPVFKKAGMERLDNSVVKPPSGLTTDLKSAGFDTDKWYDKEYCKEFMSEKENRRVIADYASELSNYVTPGGKNLENDEVENKLLSEDYTAGRVLWNVRKKELAKFVGPEFSN